LTELVVLFIGGSKRQSVKVKSVGERRKTLGNQLITRTYVHCSTQQWQ